MADALLLLGSNLDKEVNIPAALAALRATPDLELIRVSSTYLSQAIGPDGQPSQQPAFHNLAVRVRTSMQPDQLRRTLRTIERQLGRIRTADKFAARPIDIDISLFDESILNPEGDAIPDPDIACFPHVAIPLAEIAPDWILPITGERLDSIAGRLNDKEMELIRL